MPVRTLDHRNGPKSSAHRNWPYAAPSGRVAVALRATLGSLSLGFGQLLQVELAIGLDVVAERVCGLTVRILVESAFRERDDVIDSRTGKLHRPEAQSANALVVLPELSLIDVLNKGSKLPRSAAGW